MFVRRATTDDALDVRRILDAAVLDPGDVEGRVAAGDVLVAGDRVPATNVRDTTGDASNAATEDTSNVATEDASNVVADALGSRAERERVLGALVLEPHEFGAHVLAISVRRRHRNRGIGRALIEHALDREGTLSARFDAGAWPFYDSLDFSIDSVDDHRFRGCRRA